MDNSLSESARFAVYREKLKGICEANNLSYVFIKNAYPIKLVIRPLGGVGEQMSMLEEATEDNYISPGAFATCCPMAFHGWSFMACWP